MKWLKWVHCQEALTGGFSCAVMDLSGNLWPLLVPEYSGTERPAFPGAEESRHLLVSHYGDKYPPLSLIGIALCFVKSGILIFAENNYSIYVHARLIKTPLLHQSFGPHVFLSFSLSLSFWLISWSAEAGCVTQGILASLALSLSHRRLRTTRRFQSIKGATSDAQKQGLRCTWQDSDGVTPRACWGR